MRKEKKQRSNFHIQIATENSVTFVCGKHYGEGDAHMHTGNGKEGGIPVIDPDGR